MRFRPFPVIRIIFRVIVKIVRVVKFILTVIIFLILTLLVRFVGPRLTVLFSVTPFPPFHTKVRRKWFSDHGPMISIIPFILTFLISLFFLRASVKFQPNGPCKVGTSNLEDNDYKIFYEVST